MWSRMNESCLCFELLIEENNRELLPFVPEDAASAGIHGHKRSGSSSSGSEIGGWEPEKCSARLIVARKGNSGGVKVALIAVTANLMKRCALLLRFYVFGQNGEIEGRSQLCDGRDNLPAILLGKQASDQ